MPYKARVCFHICAIASSYLTTSSASCREDPQHMLLYIIDKLSIALGNGNGVADVFMDFIKAFDRVWHNGLLYQLGLLGVLPSSLKWIQSYLTDRSFYVQIENAMSKPFAISSGVPQGSHLGSVLFTVFINDLPDTCRSSTDMYANDTLLHQTISECNSTDLDKLQESVTNASHSAHSWRGQFCPGKTVLLPVGQTATTVCASTSVVIEDEPIQVVTSHKHLGLIISSDLRWSSQIENLLQKANHRAGLLWHMPRHYTSRHPITTLPFVCWTNNGICKSRVARIDYYWPSTVAGARTSWCFPMPTKSWLDDTEASDAGASRMASTPPAESSRKHNPLPSVIQPPSWLEEQVSPTSSSQMGRSLRKSEQLLLPKLRTKRLSNSFFFPASLLRNSMPANIQNLQKSEYFKLAVEQHWAALKLRPSAEIPLPAMNWRHSFLPSPL